ncbi:MAG: YfiR family protein [Nitrospirae bacterium]|nr:YfiR family protein [Nitrospirota bacterium]
MRYPDRYLLNFAQSPLPPFQSRTARTRKWAGYSQFSRFAILAAFLSSLFSFVWAVPLQRVSYAQQQSVKEYELKAVYLYNFLQFVQWPPSKRLISKDGAMVIGVVGESPFGDALDVLQADVRNSGMKPVKVIQYGAYQEDMDLGSCHLLFVSASEKSNFRKITAGLRDAPVLTVADSENFLSSGGMVNLVQSGGKIRWSINRTPADRAGLRFSSQLLNIAVRIVDGR